MPTRGVLHVEARVYEDIELGDIQKLRADLETYLNRPDQVFDYGEDLLAVPWKAEVLLNHFYKETISAFDSLKVVDYHGPEGKAACYSSNDITVKVHAYQLYTYQEESKDLQQAVVNSMPHVDFDGQWNQLEFNDDLKEEMVQLITNLLRYRKYSNGKSSPLVLLYGLPGTGKTTLCRSLAQKVAIRFKGAYQQTKLMEIKTATILSKYYSESAKRVDEMFTAIEKMCEDNSDQFLCVLIDEVESIANSRESSMRGEAQDSLRATNALLTGLDRVRKYCNLIILCTSNILECLDSAFLDRCSFKRLVNVPAVAVKYEILRSNIQAMVDDGTISGSANVLPSYRDAGLQTLDFDELLPGCKLLHIVNLIQDSGTDTSGRYLSQLPFYSVMLYLGDGEECTLDVTLGFIQKSVDADIISPHGQKRKRDEDFVELVC